MSRGMQGELLKVLQQDTEKWAQCKRLFRVREFAAGSTLLREGDVSRTMYFIKRGCLRLWFNKEGKDITFQFFFENQGVSSFESFFAGKPSIFSLESIEPTIAATISRGNWDTMLTVYPALKESFQEVLIERMGTYARLFLSMIKNSPRERYEALVRERPDILQRVPQRYIASYLGITPVSLSRIRGRIHRKH